MNWCVHESFKNVLSEKKFNMSFASKPAEPNKSQTEDKHCKLKIGILVVKHQSDSLFHILMQSKNCKILPNVRAGKGRRDM